MSGEDDDATPPRGQPGWMTDSQRATIGAPHRRSRSYPLGIPIGRPAPEPQGDLHEITDPVILLERGLLPEEQRIVSDSCGDGGQPVPYAQFAKLVHRQYEQERRRRKRDTDQVREIEELRAAVRPETIERIDQRLSAAERAQRRALKLVIAAAMAVATGLGGAAKLLLDGAERRGGEVERLKQIERSLDEFRQDIRELRIELGRRSSLDTDVGSLASQPHLLTNQGPTP